MSRSTGRSSVQSVAYICGEKIHEEYRGKEADYTKRRADVFCYKTIVPENCKYSGLEVWNEVENFENRYGEKRFKNEYTRARFLESAQTAQTIVVALPNELSSEGNVDLVEKFIDTRFKSRGLVSTYAIHKANGNVHAHVQISRRAIVEDGEFSNSKDREICTKSALLETRKLWADLANEALSKEGFKERITEKSFADLGVNLEASKHRGWYADVIGTDSRIVQENLEISRRNEEAILQNPSVIFDLLNDKKAVFTQKDMLNEIGKRVFDPNKIARVFEKCLEEAKYVGEGVKGEFLYTGEKYERLESDALSAFDTLMNKESQTVCNEKSVTSVLNKYDYLSDEQAEAIRSLTSTSSVGILLGKAGAGKTTAMKAVSEIYVQNGARVIGMSLSAVASENLGKDAGIESATIASWSHRWRAYDSAKEKFLSFDAIVSEGVLKQFDWYRDLKMYESSQLKKGDVIVLDEAGMTGTSDWKTVLDFANKFEAKVIAVGDDNQFKPISAGDLFRSLRLRGSLQLQAKMSDVSEKSSEAVVASDVGNSNRVVVELSEIRRQKSEWMREASVEFSKLNTAEGLTKYENRGRVHGIEADMVYESVVGRYLELEKEGSVAVLCATKAECANVNDAVREMKKSAGTLGNDVTTINGRGLALNDCVIFLKNDRDMGVKNGQVGVVSGFCDNSLFVKTEFGTKAVDVEAYKDIDHSYAITLHKSQGKTYDNAVLLANKIMDAKAFYVGMTRHRENVDLFYNASEFKSFNALVNSASKYIHKDSIADYRSVDNIYKSKVMEYKETLLEMSGVLKDINTGVGEWSDYRRLKSHNVEVGKEILSDIGKYDLYLKQMGITREKLEISMGERSRPLSGVELTAKHRVDLYSQASDISRKMYEEMKAEEFNVKHHENYDKYNETRELRNDLAKEILANYPLHRTFVNEAESTFGISKKAMENQVNYEKSQSQETKQETKIDDVSKNGSGIDYFAEKLNTHNKELMTGVCYVSTEAMIERAKEKISVGLYGFNIEAHREKHGYGRYVINGMVERFIGYNKLDVGTEHKLKISEYASMLVDKHVSENHGTTASADIIESAMKTAVCFEALKDASKTKQLTSKEIEMFHEKAKILSKHLTEQNITALNDKCLMRDVLSNLRIPKADSILKNDDISRLIQLNKEEISKENELAISHEKTKEIDLGW